MINNNEIKLNNKIYKKKAIENAVNAFSELANFEINSKGDYYLVEVEMINDVDPVALSDEFTNYVLYSMKNI